MGSKKFSLVVNDELFAMLETISKAEERSRNYITNKALREYCEVRIMEYELSELATNRDNWPQDSLFLKENPEKTTEDSPVASKTEHYLGDSEE